MTERDAVHAGRFVMVHGIDSYYVIPFENLEAFDKVAEDYWNAALGEKRAPFYPDWAIAIDSPAAVTFPSYRVRDVVDFSGARCPQCGESGGEVRFKHRVEFQGDAAHGGPVEFEDEVCSLCWQGGPE